MRITDAKGLRSAEQGWHAHVSDSAYVKEITVYREDDVTATG